MTAYCQTVIERKNCNSVQLKSFVTICCSQYRLGAEMADLYKAPFFKKKKRRFIYLRNQYQLITRRYVTLRLASHKIDVNYILGLTPIIHTVRWHTQQWSAVEQYQRKLQERNQLYTLTHITRTVKIIQV